MPESGASGTRFGEGGVTPWDLVEVDDLRAWRCLLDSQGGWHGRTWYRASQGDAEMMLPRLTNAQPPDQQFFTDVGRLLKSKTHPRILLPARVITANALRPVRQVELRGWINGAGHVDASVEVPFEAIEKLVTEKRDHGPSITDPDYWVGIAVRVVHGYTVGDFCRETRGNERTLRRQLRDVQQRLHASGVLPWVGYADAVVPATWQTDGTLEPALEQWRREAQAIDAMRCVIDGLVAGLAAFELTDDADLARAVLRGHLRRVS